MGQKYKNKKEQQRMTKDLTKKNAKRESKTCVSRWKWLPLHLRDDGEN
jgi:hypothetical protein